jgi:hypothetical protein
MNFFNTGPSMLAVNRVIRVAGDIEVLFCRINVWTDWAGRTPTPLLVETLCLPETAATQLRQSLVAVTVCEPPAKPAAP